MWPSGVMDMAMGAGEVPIIITSGLCDTPSERSTIACPMGRGRSRPEGTLRGGC